ncbi:MAG: heavy metal translocating P-type ATPase [Hyphomicrobiaceae bacterium]
MDSAIRHQLEAHPTSTAFATTTLAVANMNCGGCMRKVESTLAAVPGVISARANLSAKRVSAVHAPGETEAIALIDALDAVGFVAAELAQANTSERDTADRDFLRRIGVAGFAAANIMLLSISVWVSRGGDMSPSVQSLFHWLSALIGLPAIAYAGVPFFRSAAQALFARRVNMDVPISLGVTLATLMSVYQTVRGTEQVYFDAAVTLLFFLLLGRFLDQRMRTRAAGAAANLLGLSTFSATVVDREGKAARVSSKALTPGMHVLTAAGERFAADGNLLEGSGDVDQSLITGESAPRRVEPGAFIYAGTINLSAPMLVEATSTSDNTLLAEIARLMTIAEQARGRYVRLADRAAGLYAPLVHAFGLLTFLGWVLAGHGWEEALTASIAVLIITCPCALALAVPAVQVAATSRLFAQGVLVKSPDALERLAEVDTVVFDKTGTLTLGRPNLVNAGDLDARTLTAAASMAASSRHPYARALVKAAEDRQISLKASTTVKDTAGFGLERDTDAGRERLGSALWCGLSDDRRGASLCYRDVNGNVTTFILEDAMRPLALDTVNAIQQGGLSIEILSGDRQNAVAPVATALNITQYRAQLLPTQKIQRLKDLAESGHKVLMVGDGLNDAPALAAAHASLSPSTATDISQTTADVVFQGDALAPVAETLAVARACQRMALQNFAIAIGYNVMFVPLAMAGHVTPLLAAIAMSASSLAVTGNALRLRTRKVRL